MTTHATMRIFGPNLRTDDDDDSEFLNGSTWRGGSQLHDVGQLAKSSFQGFEASSGDARSPRIERQVDGTRYCADVSAVEVCTVMGTAGIPR